MENWKLATNAELEERMKTLTDEYAVSQQQIADAYDNMLKLSNEYSEIKSILNKRKGIKEDESEQ